MATFLSFTIRNIINPITFPHHHLLIYPMVDCRQSQGNPLFVFTFSCNLLHKYLDNACFEAVCFGILFLRLKL